MISDFLFSPDYKIFFNDGGGYATTTWHNNVQSYGQITKTSKHWSGEYTVGNWELELNDVDSEIANFYSDGGTRSYKSIWGSLYGLGSEARGKTILFRAKTTDVATTYVSQFEGQIQDITAENGKISLLIQDKLGGLDDKRFIYDYVNIGSQVGTLVWGRVKRIFGTQVMFDDFGTSEYIERKSPETTFWDTALGGVLGGAVGLVAGGLTFGIGAAMGFLGGALGNLPKESQVTAAYYKYTDFNFIPDNTVASGQKVKFYVGSIDAVATNSNSPLINIQEKTILGGKFENGIYGTFEFADTTGIKVDDWIYVRKPLRFAGTPDEIVKQILCGSNINTPYATTSFSPSWNNEMENIELLNLGRVIGVDEEISPFDLLKELFSEIKVNFYIDENNLFSCRTIRPRGFNSSDTGTYNNNTNINNFQYKRSAEEVQNGFVMYYDWVGQGGAYNSEYNRQYILHFKNPITSISKFGTVVSKWIHNEDDARAICYRQMFDTERGIDRGVLDTFLNGITQNTADTIRVTHPTGSIVNRLFEIESYSKDFTSSKVKFNLIDAERIYGYGNCVWATTFANVTGSSVSGFGYTGHIAGSAGTWNAIEHNLSVSDTIATFASEPSISHYYCCFGSLSNQYTEVFFIGTFNSGTVGTNTFYYATLQRGMFNTIQRPVASASLMYTLATVSYDSTGQFSPLSLLGKFNLATTYYIQSVLGTVFKFF
jgi:hypothetical protein